MAITKKSIVKSSAPRNVTTKTPKSTVGSPAVPAGKMVTAMRMAKTAKLARTIAC